MADHSFPQNVWLGTTLLSGRWHADRRLWELHIQQNGKEITIEAVHVVMAVGAGCQIPVVPTYPGIVCYSTTKAGGVQFVLTDSIGEISRYYLALGRV